MFFRTRVSACKLEDGCIYSKNFFFRFLRFPWDSIILNKDFNEHAPK